mmetsp:Transcript_35904/g.94116  ORF Transcript_35904/g.94116 Transcript_35904/m.94116 type:complete len:219 (+) Transcript_35904:178-834(+)
MPKPIVLSTARISLLSSCSNDVYGDSSIRLKHVCALGRVLGGFAATISIVNFLGPSEPLRSAKPVTGTREVPVENCNKRARISLSIPSTAFQNHLMTGSLASQFLYSVFLAQSSTLIAPSPHTSSSSSFSSNMSINLAGTTSSKPALIALLCSTIPSKRRWRTIKSTYSCLLSSVTATLAPPAFSSTAETSPKLRCSSTKVLSITPAISLSSIHTREL